MQELLLIGNPARRTHKRKRKASPAQLRALAKGRAARKAKSRTHVATVRHNPVKHRTHKRKVHHARKHHYRTRRNPATRGISARSIMAELRTAGVGAVGAIGVDALFGFVTPYLPAALATPKDASGANQYGYYVAKGAAAFGVGMLLRRMIGANRAAAVTQGSLTVTMHGPVSYTHLRAHET